MLPCYPTTHRRSTAKPASAFLGNPLWRTCRERAIRCCACHDSSMLPTLRRVSLYADALLIEEKPLIDEVGKPQKGGLPLNTALDVYHPAESRKSIRRFVCPRCECSLTLHQPDSDLPDRLLATCDECKSWHLATSEGTELRPIIQPKGRPRRR